MSTVLRPAFAAILLALFVAAGCDTTTDPGPPGEVRGMVSAEGLALPGVIVELTGDGRIETTTDPTGRFVFTDVPAGAWVVTIRGYPVDASFGVTSKPAVIAREEGRRTVTVDFQGNFIRTASVSGTVLSGSRGLQNVEVRVEGPDILQTATDADGRYAVTGLRRGEYVVEISGFPSSVEFPSTRAQIQLGTGENATVSFEGQPDVTATVHISGLHRRLPSGEMESLDPTNVRGQIHVVVTVDWGDDTPEAVALLLDDEIVGEQRFSTSGAPIRQDQDRTAPQPVVEGDSGAASFDLTFTVTTDEFDPETGQVRFPNGERHLRARLSTREAGEAAWTAEVPIRLRNSDTFVAELDPQRGPVAGDDGNDWIGGDLGMRIRPVLFNTDRTVSSLTVELRRSGGAQLRERSVGGDPPFHPVFPGSGEAGSTNVVGYQTPAGATDELRVRAALYGDGTSVPNTPIQLIDGLRIDNVPPPGAAFRLPQQGAERDCCLGNWVGVAFAFASGVQVEPDEGVGGESMSVHVGDASLSNDELAGQVAVVTGSDLAESATSNAYSAVAVIRDALDNRRVVRLEPSDGNPLGNALGGVFGIDRTPPRVRFASTSLMHGTVNPAGGDEWTVRAEDEASGFGSQPARTTVRRLAPGVDGAAACPFPGTSACQDAPDGLSRALPGHGEGYFVYATRVLDRAGNRSEQLESAVLRDQTPPQIEELVRPSALVSAETVTVSAPASDNVDLHRGVLGFVFGGLGGPAEPVRPFVRPDTLGRAFQGSPLGTATAQWETMVVAGLERADGGGETGSAPSGTVRSASGLVATVTDVAGNDARLEVGTNIGLPEGGLRSFSVSTRGVEGGVAGWETGAAGSSVCAPPAAWEESAACPAGSSSLTLHATARGEGGAFEPPFGSVHFYAVVNGRARWLGRAGAEQLLADGTGSDARAWRWHLEWTPEPGLPTGGHPLLAIGVDGSGLALETVPLEGVSVTAPPN